MDVKRLQKTTKKQYEELLTFVQKNKVIAGNFKCNPSDYTKINKLWEEFAKHINSLGYGPPKTAKQWRHIFTEWKQNIRRKSRDIKKEQIGTGGGPSKSKSLTDLEERLLSLIGLVHLGHTEVLDSMGTNEIPLTENYIVNEQEEVSTYTVETSLVDELENVSTVLFDHNYQLQETIVPQQNENVEENDDQQILMTNTETSTKETADKHKFKRNPKTQNRQILHEATKNYENAQKISLDVEKAKSVSINNVAEAIKHFTEAFKENNKHKKAALKLEYFKTFGSYENFNELYE